MTPGWVAGSVRARLLASRRIGRRTARDLASASLDVAIERLSRSTYGRGVKTGMSLEQAQRGVADTTVWNLRVLAGWLAARGVEVVRVLSSGFEIANIESHVARLAGGVAPRPLDLGTLALAWPAVARTSDPVAARAALTASSWGDPGADSLPELGVAIRLRWARRVAELVPRAAPWAESGAAIVVARELLVHRRSLTVPAAREASRLVGPAVRTSSLAAFVAVLPRAMRWPFEGLEDPEDLWRAEARWWSRIETESKAMVRRASAGRDTIVGAVGLLICDAVRVCSALEAAAWGPNALEVFDVVA